MEEEQEQQEENQPSTLAAELGKTTSGHPGNNENETVTSKYKAQTQQSFSNMFYWLCCAAFACIALYRISRGSPHAAGVQQSTNSVYE